MSVRPARASDAVAVARLLTELGSPDVDEAEARTRIGRPGQEVYVEEHDGEVRGLVALAIELYVGHQDPLVHLTALVTDPSARRSGVADALLNTVVQRARELGCAGVELTCGISPARAAAHEFYLAHGFRRTSYRYWLPAEQT